MNAIKYMFVLDFIIISWVSQMLMMIIERNHGKFRNRYILLNILCIFITS